VLVSGDHHTWSYDEPDTMREALLRAGVPASAIFTDHAGFDTWASMVRARKVFGARNVIVVTQGFHMARALYLARVKAVADAAVDGHVMLGPPVPITGDGRDSWGPPPPPGTPPAGAPDR
jgi:SanA protein